MQRFEQKLGQLEAQNRLRSLNLPCGIDLTSNDYLGLAEHPALREAAIQFLQQGGDIGAGGSRLLRGHTDPHAALEEYAATYFAAPKTLYFATGFQANTALFQALPHRHDVIVFDEFVHASAREGIQNAAAKHVKVQHNDLNAFEDALLKARQKNPQHIWIAVESVYSMDGDIAPLEELYALAEKFDATLIIDEAHGTGVMGPHGKGVSEDLVMKHGYERIITLHTCGKALGVAGGLVCASADTVDYLINTARGFIYSTAPLPLQAHLVKTALEICASEAGAERRRVLEKLCQKAQQFFGGPGTHIVPIVIGDDAACADIAQKLQSDGYDIRAIRPPTVPEGGSRLRLSLSASLSDDVLSGFFEDFKKHQQKRAA